MVDARRPDVNAALSFVVTASRPRPPSDRALEAAILARLEARGTATMCPSEVARELGGTTWRALMPRVRAAAARLEARHALDVYQRGQPVALATARGPIRLRARQVDGTRGRAAAIARPPRRGGTPDERPRAAGAGRR